MDVLVADDDNLVSLEEALAFIYNCDINDCSFTDTLLGAVPEQSSPIDAFSQMTPSDLLPPKAPGPPTARKRAKPQRKLAESSSSQDENSTKKRRTRSAASSSTRLQQRKRAEIQALREQAQELETQVELLKKNKFLAGDTVLELDAQLSANGDGALVAKDQKAPANWHELAIAQYKERLVSEKTNRRLKSILSNQEKVNGALSGLLQKRSMLQGMDYVLSTKPPLDAPLISSDDSVDAPSCGVTKTTLAELEQVAQRMHKEAKANERKPSPAVSCDMWIKHDARRGKLIEFVTTTPMSCTVEDATELVWKEFTTHREFSDRVYKGMRCDKPNTQAKNFVMSLRSPSGLLELDGVQYIQKFEEVDKTIFAFAKRMFLPTKSLQFRDECWMTVTPLGSNASVVEIFLQLYMERGDGIVASPQGLTHAQNIVMGSLSNTLRKICQAQQNTLMEKAGRIIAAPSSGIV